jgi:hypothetical protein
MKKRRCPPVPVTITKFTQDRIILKSTSDGSIFVNIPACLGIYLFVLGCIECLSGISLIPGPSIILVLIGIVLNVIAFGCHRESWEIHIDDKTQSISGLRDNRFEIPFKDISGIHLVPEEESDDWRVELEMNDKSDTVLVWDYPLDVAVFLGHHLSYMIARPFIMPKNTSMPAPPEQRWMFPFKMPKGRFFAEWLIFSAALAAGTVIFKEFASLNVFGWLLFPRWLLIISVAVPGAFLLINVLDKKGVRSTVRTSVALIILIVLCGACAVAWPASASCGLIAMLCFGIMTINARIQGKRLVLLLIVTLICGAAGIPLTAKSISTYMTLRHIDPGVIETIVFSKSINTADDQTDKWTVEKPAEIREIVKNISKADFYKFSKTARSHALFVFINRPFGHNNMLKMYREGAGASPRVVLEIWDQFLGRSHRFGVFSSTEMDATLTTIGSRNGFWPQGYEE